MPRVGDLLTVGQAAELAGVDRSSLLRAVQTGRLRGVRVGSVYVLTRAELAKYRPRRPKPKAEAAEAVTAG